MEETYRHETSVFGRFCRLRTEALGALSEKAGLHVAQPPVLSLLMFYPGMTIMEIAEKLRLAQASVTNNVSRMEKMGLVTKTQDADDGRKIRVNVTEKGQKCFEAVEASIKQFNEEMFAGFSEEEKARMLEDTKRIIHNIEKFLAE